MNASRPPSVRPPQVELRNREDFDPLQAAAPGSRFAGKAAVEPLRVDGLSVAPVVIPRRPVESAAPEAAILESGDPSRMDMVLCDQASRINSLFAVNDWVAPLHFATRWGTRDVACSLS